MKSALAFGERPPETPLPQRAGLRSGRAGWAVNAGKPALLVFYLKPSGAARCPQGKGSLASLVLPVSPASASVLTLGSSLMGPLFPVPHSSSSPSLEHPVPCTSSALTSSPRSLLLTSWVSAEVLPPPGSLP